MSYDDKIAAAADVSADYINKLISGEIDPTKEALQIARFAAASVSNYTRHLSVKHNHERTVLGLVKTVYQEPVDFLTYARAALPDAGFVKALEAPKTEGKEAA